MTGQRSPLPPLGALPCTEKKQGFGIPTDLFTPFVTACIQVTCWPFWSTLGVHLVNSLPCLPCFSKHHVFLLKQIQNLWNSTTSKWKKNMFQVQLLNLESRVSTWSLWFLYYLNAIYGKCLLAKKPCSWKPSPCSLSTRFFENIVRKQQPVKHLNGL